MDKFLREEPLTQFVWVLTALLLDTHVRILVPPQSCDYLLNQYTYDVGTNQE